MSARILLLLFRERRECVSVFSNHRKSHKLSVMTVRTIRRIYYWTEYSIARWPKRNKGTPESDWQLDIWRHRDTTYINAPLGMQLVMQKQLLFTLW